MRDEPLGSALWAAQLLARHVATLKGRANTLTATVDELNTAVSTLVDVLTTAKE